MRPVVPAFLAFLSSLFALFAVGCGAPSFLITPVANTSSLQEHKLRGGKGWSPPKVAIVEVEGMLSNARQGGFLQASENKVSLFAQEMARAAADKDVKAVVLRVNSPGGTVTASDTMYQIVKDFRAKTGKPVVASTQEVAASGAYYISLAADRIVAHPTSVVGSVGVIFSAMEFEGTLSKLGINAYAVKSGSLKDMGSPFKAVGPEERALMQEMVDEYFLRFEQLVRQSRPITEPPAGGIDAYRKPEYAGVFSGRVYSGEQAVKVGLADQTGGLEDAIKLAKQLGKARGAEVIMYKRPYGYTGSIYASGSTPAPKADVMRLEVPGLRDWLPTGFYYLWQPGL